MAVNIAAASGPVFMAAMRSLLSSQRFQAGRNVEATTANEKLDNAAHQGV
jgi:hypothetical protein